MRAVGPTPAPTVTLLLADALAPAVVVTVSVTRCVPCSEKRCVTNEPVAVSPSPKFHSYVHAEPHGRPPRVLPDPSNEVRANCDGDAGVKVNDAVGMVGPTS